MTPIKSSGSAGVLPIECINPRKNTYRIRWNITEKPDGTAEWTEQDFDHRPSLDEIKSAIIASINQATEAAIIAGMTYEGHPVWLSPENQRNYLTALALAQCTATVTQSASTDVQSASTDAQSASTVILPVTVKLGTDQSPVYRTFFTLSSLAAFCTAVESHIQCQLRAGWAAKDAINLALYTDVQP